ncbi:MAG TPA: GIY-YIG nuclease family protein [Caulobacteraceae bacterium]
MEKSPAVYVMASGQHGTIYIGVTGDLIRRTYEHREGLTPGFTEKYGCNRLVWYEMFTSIEAAIHREKSLKRWPRAWKCNLIERENPLWQDLYPVLTEWTPVPLRPDLAPLLPRHPRPCA